jgi:hypothetical protein
MSRLFVSALVAAALALTACGDSPEGPADLPAVVDGGGLAIGAIVIQIQGTGVGAVGGVGSTRAFAEEASVSSKRAVLVTDVSGPLRFTVHVEDQSLPLPTATVIEAIDLNNEPITNVVGIEVRIER